MKKPEILAPAGNLSSLTAALRTGADAVYIGGKNFSARNGATNFSDDEIGEAATMCHRYGAKLYLAVNTIISDDELADFCNYVRKAAECGVDAFIVQDWGAFDIIRKTIPRAVIHASTQMSVHTAAGAEFLRKIGFSRVVPARELPAETIEKICRTGIETEIFVHGALCMSVSGQCYMSAFMGSRSANRGCCGQACRLPFSAECPDRRNALSLKDLSLIDHTEKIKSLGVDSLKIEGRMKRPEYVAATVSEFRKSVNGEEYNKKMLADVFSRSGFTDGYFTGRKKNMFGIRERENSISAKSVFPVIHEFYRSERPTFGVSFEISMKADKPIFIKAVCGDVSAEIFGDIPEVAKKAPTDAEILKKQFSKLGETVFFMENFSADVDIPLFVPVSKLNDYRRKIVEKLGENILKKNTPVYETTSFTPSKSGARAERRERLPVRTFCRTAEQAFIAAASSEYIILPLKIINKSLTEKIAAEKIIVSPPRFIADEEKLFSELAEIKKLGVERLLCHTPDGIATGQKLGMKLHGNFTLNVFNSYSADFLSSLGLEDCIFSVEATTEQLGKVNTSLPLGAIVYGRLPLMLTRNCPVKNEVGCDRCTHQLTDRTSRVFPVVCSGDYTEILNCDILDMRDRVGELKNISFLVALPDDCRTGGKMTHGLYYRGVIK